MPELFIIGISPSSSIIIAARRKLNQTIYGLDLRTGRVVSSFPGFTASDEDTCYFTVDRLGELGIAAVYSKGTAAYSLESGDRLWFKTELNHVQRIWCSPLDDTFCIERGVDTVMVNDRNGAELDRQSGIRKRFVSSFSDVALLEPKGKGAYTVRQQTTGINYKIQRATFTLLDAAFSSTLLITSEAGGPVRCFDVSLGIEIGRLSFRQGEHILALHYDQLTGFFYAVSWNYAKGGPHIMLRLHSDLSGFDEIATIPAASSEVKFCANTQQLLEMDGRVYDLATGNLRCDINSLVSKS